MRCPRCGADNPDTNTICKCCHAPLPSATPINTGEPSETQPLAFCPQCRTPMRPGLTTCPCCGYRA